MYSIPFTKMHGLGNDYIYIDTVSHSFPLPLDTPQWTLQVQQWSHRHTGIGGDGVVLILPSRTADFAMRIFNADGSEAQMCGNASRCIGKYVYEQGLKRKTTLSLETLSGIKTLHLHLQDGQVDSVSVDMGIPQALSAVSLQQEGYRLELTAVDMGNPHAVWEVENIENAPVALIGPLVEHAKVFPDRTNVEFVQVINRRELAMRVWERGSGETMACGTGACAAAVAALHHGRVDDTVVVHLRGGDLTIQRLPDEHILMTGTATRVFEGRLQVDAFTS